MCSLFAGSLNQKVIKRTILQNLENHVGTSVIYECLIGKTSCDSAEIIDQTDTFTCFSYKL